jgi:outer membrane biosynthesis protein TonB
MATANPPPAKLEQPSAPVGPGNPHIDQLQAMLNLIFVSSGRFLKETQAGGGTGRMKLNLEQTVPLATERFHDALDELENEVRLAQTVLRRDMAELKQHRKKREAAAKQHEAEKARLAAESKNAPAPVEEAPPKVEKVTTPAAPEAPVVPEEPAKAKEPEEPLLKREAEDVKAPLPAPIETNIEPPKDPLFDATPTTANPQESDFDFDAMFGDAMDTSGDNNHDDMMDATGDIDFNLDDGNDGPSLLRGLEDFAKDSHDDNTNHTSNMDMDMDMDFTMPDLPDLNADATTDAKPAPEPEPAPVPAPTSAPAPAPAPKVEEAKPAPPQPAAEEKKEESPTEDDMMASMGANDLDDLFNMDDYANPEQSSFDDAFFNFE